MNAHKTGDLVHHDTVGFGIVLETNEEGVYNIQWCVRENLARGFRDPDIDRFKHYVEKQLHEK